MKTAILGEDLARNWNLPHLAGAEVEYEDYPEGDPRHGEMAALVTYDNIVLARQVSIKNIDGVTMFTYAYDPPDNEE